MILKKTVFCLLILTALLPLTAQELLLFPQKGNLAATRSFPGSFIGSKYNISLPGAGFLAFTEGPSVDKATKKNSQGKRYLSFAGMPSSKGDFSNIYAEADIRTLDVGIRFGNYALLAGHAFRRQANFRYPHSLLLLATQGNAPFVGETLPIGPKIDVQAYNEFYLGGQLKWKRFSAGVRAKLLYGTANMYTEKSEVSFTTRPENYGIELEAEYLVRSSGLFRYYSFDSLTFSTPGLTFDNLFYNNAGWGLDVGVTYEVNNSLTIAASALDIGAIRWDFFPREYKSKGTYVFEGLDLAEYIGDTTGIMVEDTLLRVIEVNSGQKTYSTSLPTRLLIAANYRQAQWDFAAQWGLRSVSADWLMEATLGLTYRTGPIRAGVQYMLGKNLNGSRPGIYSGFGGLVSLTLGKVCLYLQSDGLPGMLFPLQNRRASLNAGCTVQF